MRKITEHYMVKDYDKQVDDYVYRLNPKSGQLTMHGLTLGTKEDVLQKGARLIRMVPASEPDYIVEPDISGYNADDIIKSSEKEGGWVSIDERLPEYFVQVLFYARIMRSQMVGHLDSNGKITPNGRNYYVKEWASHWRPLPAPPMS